MEKTKTEKMFEFCNTIWYLFDTDRDKLDDLLADTPWNPSYVRWFMCDIYRKQRDLLDDPWEMIRTIREALNGSELRREAK